MAVPDDLAQRLATAARKGVEWQARRDALILEAVDAGGSQREVAKLAGLTQPAIHAILQRHRQGEAS